MNAISKHIFNQSRELAKLPTVEHIRESVFGGKTSVDDLIARVDNTIAIYCDPVPRTCYQAARFLARVKEHLCNRVMTAGEVQAWYEINDAQQSLSLAPRRCEALIADSEDQYGRPCGSICEAGKEVCQEHESQ